MILICSGQDNSANNSLLMRFSRIKSSVTGTSYRERKNPRGNPYVLPVAQKAGNLTVSECKSFDHFQRLQLRWSAPNPWRFATLRMGRGRSLPIGNRTYHAVTPFCRFALCSAEPGTRS